MEYGRLFRQNERRKINNNNNSTKSITRICTNQIVSENKFMQYFHKNNSKKGIITNDHNRSHKHNQKYNNNNHNQKNHNKNAVKSKSIDSNCNPNPSNSRDGFIDFSVLSVLPVEIREEVIRDYQINNNISNSTFNENSKD